MTPEERVDAAFLAWIRKPVLEMWEDGHAPAADSDRLRELLVAAVREAVAAERVRCVKAAVEAVNYHYGYSGQMVADAIRKEK